MAIHAGLECGLLLDKMPGAEAISLGPDMFDVHTPNEHLDIQSTENTWNYLLAILKSINFYPLFLLIIFNLLLIHLYIY